MEDEVEEVDIHLEGGSVEEDGVHFVPFLEAEDRISLRIISSHIIRN